MPREPGSHSPPDPSPRQANADSRQHNPVKPPLNAECRARNPDCPYNLQKGDARHAPSLYGCKCHHPPAAGGDGGHASVLDGALRQRLLDPFAWAAGAYGRGPGPRDAGRVLQLPRRRGGLQLRGHRGRQYGDLRPFAPRRPLHYHLDRALGDSQGGRPHGRPRRAASSTRPTFCAPFAPRPG